jgi:hypothetical protein
MVEPLLAMLLVLLLREIEESMRDKGRKPLLLAVVVAYEGRGCVLVDSRGRECEFPCLENNGFFFSIYYPFS